MLIDFLSNDARAEEAARALRLDRRYTVRSGFLFSEKDTPPDLIVLPIPATRDGCTLNGTPYTLKECRRSLLCASKPPFLLGYGPCPEMLTVTDYRDLSKDEDFVSANAELTAEGGMSLLHEAMQTHGLSLLESVAVVIGYGRIARAMALRLSANGAHVLIGARRATARQAAHEAGYLTFDCTAPTFFEERGRLLFSQAPHFLVNTVPSPSVLVGLDKMPSPLFSLELSGKADVLCACQSLPYPTIDGKAIPARFFPKTAGKLLGEAILRHCAY